jgi:hypothetical protein
MISSERKIALKVLVFKTNISTDTDLNSAAKILSQVNEILCWNVDRHDVDNVLRVESCVIEPSDIIKILCAAGFQCQELPD